ELQQARGGRLVAGGIPMHERPFDIEDGHRVTDRGRIRYAIITALNFTLFLAVMVAGVAYSSKALIANGLHLLLDVGSLLISTLASSLSGRAPSKKNSFGLVRLEVVSALITSVSLLLASIYLVVDAVIATASRQSHASGLIASYLELFGVVGIVVNFISILLLAGVSGDRLLKKANLLHFAADSVSWVVALLAGLLARYITVSVSDLLATVAVAAVIVSSTLSIIREIVSILLDSVPSRLSIDAIEDEIMKVARVIGVHHLHVWSLSSNELIFSGHVMCDSAITIHEGQEVVAAIKEMLERQFSIRHATIEIECHVCDVPIHQVADVAGTHHHSH
ncbi:MAG: cation diffusion facilitator family transporter, partial [Actinomycetota bacterium]|nr:cation diffusion facilitator family transporter [Actinomycetota bacterium]